MKTFGTAFLLLMALSLRVHAASDAEPPQPAEMRSADFLATLGVNTHIGSIGYNDPIRLAVMLSYIGIDKIRQSSPGDAEAMATLRALGQSGVKIDVILNGGGPVDLVSAMQSVMELAPHLDAIEGVNEAAIWPIEYAGLRGVDAAVALQKALYKTVRADPSFDQVAVYIFTLGGIDPAAFPAIGDLSAFTDYANIHTYPPHGLRPCFVIHAAIDGGRTDAADKPIVITETGYYTLPQNAGWGGVPETVQASYLLALLLDEAAAGVKRTYIYDLVDDGEDRDQSDREAHFGLFRFDGAPKTAARALHSLTMLMGDAVGNDAAAEPTEFSYTATGVPYNYTGNTLAFRKNDNTRVIAVWNEQQLWDPDRQQASPVRHFPVDLDLHHPYQTVQVFDPIEGMVPVQTLHDVSSVSLDVEDRPLLVVVSPLLSAGHLDGAAGREAPTETFGRAAPR